MSVFGRGLPVWIFIVAAASAPAQVAQTPAYEQALSLVKGGDYSSAVPVLEKLIQTNPADLRARNLLGIALTGAGRPLEANKQFQSLLKSNPRFLPALKNLAHNLLETGDVENAHQHFKRALDIAPADPAVHFGLAQIAFTNAQHAAAIGHYEKTNGLHLKDPLARIRYAASCAETGEREKAFGALVSFPKDAPPPLQFEAGVQLAKLEQYPEAVSRFELARSGSYDPSKTGYNLALAYLKSNNHEAAIRTAEETSKIAAAPELYSVLAQAYEKDGRTIDAYQALRTAIKLSPKDESPYLELVALCLNHENQELGLEIADIGVRLVPDSSRIRLQRGVIYALQSRFDDAAADFRAAVQLDPHAPLGYVAEALVLLRIDQVDRAIALLRHRVKTKPQDYLANWL
ncbi:MAG TPA: tetratricopeptide repeat protein, partial [Bryobacteraceae bacterium]|nr:tetratricopeptide repeat protein [Bryobacteraceae bacterium]